MPDNKPIFAGLKVLEFASFVFGPGAAMILADFGADVIKVESPGLGDPYRHTHKVPPFMPHEFAYLWHQDNRNKRSIALDMKQAEGREAFLKLVRQSDVLVTNFPPHVLERLKIRYEDLIDENPRMIYGQVTGYGENGPDANKPGFDATAYWARSGLMDLVRTAEADPAFPAAAMGDHPSAMTMYAGIVTALLHRERTGQGTKVSSSLMATGLWANSAAISGVLSGAPTQQRISRVKPRNALINQYKTSDERWMLVVALPEEKGWPILAAAIGHEELVRDPRFAETPARVGNAEGLRQIIDTAINAKDYAYWHKRFMECGVTFSLVGTVEEAANDPQALLNDMIIKIEGHNYGSGRAVNSPFWIKGADKVTPMVGPELGANSREVLAGLGYDAAAIERMIAARVVVV